MGVLPHAAALNFDPDPDYDPLIRLQSFNWTDDPEGPCFGLHHPLLFQAVDRPIFSPSTPSPTADGDQALEKQRGSKESCRNGSDTATKAAAAPPLQQPKEEHPINLSAPKIVVNISAPTKTQETASGEWGKGGNGCDEAYG